MVLVLMIETLEQRFWMLVVVLMEIVLENCSVVTVALNKFGNTGGECISFLMVDGNCDSGTQVQVISRIMVEYFFLRVTGKEKLLCDGKCDDNVFGCLKVVMEAMYVRVVMGFSFRGLVLSL